MPYNIYMNEKSYWLGFSMMQGIGPLKFKKLVDRFGSAKNSWKAPSSDLKQILGEKLTSKFEKHRKDFLFDNYQNRIKKLGVSFVTLNDKDYPPLLKQIINPPFVLYYKGSKEALNSSPTIAVVGSRRTTNYGREVTWNFVQDLVAAGFTVVSGLAIGVDAVSHTGALDGKGKTIAVLGCGVDCCTPLENQKLYNRILSEKSAVVAEVPPGYSPFKGSFPARNRIIAGLSLGVLVTEGAEDSGSLITADYGLKFNRPVFAIPGPITSDLSKGPYKLISKGAKLVTSASEIISDLNPKGVLRSRISLRETKGDTKEEAMILKLLQNEPLHFDEIVKLTNLDPAKAGSTLSVMEIKGFIKNLSGGIFSVS